MTVFISELANVSIMHVFYFYAASYRILAILYHLPRQHSHGCTNDLLNTHKQNGKCNPLGLSLGFPVSY